MQDHTLNHLHKYVVILEVYGMYQMLQIIIYTVKIVRVGSLRTRQDSPTYAKSDLHISQIFFDLHLVRHFLIQKRT